jgi:hypothetical protein
MNLMVKVMQQQLMIYRYWVMRNKEGQEDGKLQVLVSHRGDGCPFVFKFCLHLV